MIAQPLPDALQDLHRQAGMWPFKSKAQKARERQEAVAKAAQRREARYVEEREYLDRYLLQGRLSSSAYRLHVTRGGTCIGRCQSLPSTQRIVACTGNMQGCQAAQW